MTPWVVAPKVVEDAGFSIFLSGGMLSFFPVEEASVSLSFMDIRHLDGFYFYTLCSSVARRAGHLVEDRSLRVGVSGASYAFFFAAERGAELPCLFFA